MNRKLDHGARDAVAQEVSSSEEGSLTPTANRSPSDFYAEALAAIEQAKAVLPHLTSNGIGAPGGNWRRVYSGDAFDRHRNDFRVENVATAIAFLRLCVPIKTPTLGSYGLKHEAERWGAAHGMEPYITNGELIAAAVYLKFNIKKDLPEPNVFIGVGRRRVQELDPGSSN